MNFVFGKKIISSRSKPLIIGEISCNHCGSIVNAKKLIDIASETKIDAVKIQTYSPDSMTLDIDNSFFKINHGEWKGYKLYDLYKKAQTPFDWQEELFNYAKKKKILCFSTPFDEKAVDMLEKINCPIYKISSFEFTDIKLIERVIKTNKPIILSTGTSNISEISEVFKFIKRKYKNVNKILLMYCVSNYPAEIEDFNLNNIKIIQKNFNCIVGLSDHSKTNLIASNAVIMGAKIFEKHIRLDNKKGLDHSFSLNKKGLISYKRDIINSWNLVKRENFYRSTNEKKNLIYRRSIFCNEDIVKGEIIEKKKLIRIRPGHGASILNFDKIVGKKAKKNIKRGEPVKLCHIEV